MKLPWAKPISNYDSDGPRDKRPVEFTLYGARMKVSPTGDVGCHTMRDRYRVECLTCGEIIHENTTAAGGRCQHHIWTKHGSPPDYVSDPDRPGYLKPNDIEWEEPAVHIPTPTKKGQ